MSQESPGETMIAVMADDISGAAELANAARQAGFATEVQLRFCPDSAAEVICLDTATRSLPAALARQRAGEMAKIVAAAGPVFIYKKCDSVLRGSVADEALAIAGAFGKRQVLLVSANPSRQRIIRNGQYYVEGIPLAQTVFARDPEHPRHTSRVAELVGGDGRIETPDATSADDLQRLAARVDSETLAAGGVDFFSALVEAKFGRRTSSVTSPESTWRAEGPALFVCGSQAAWQGDRGGQLRKQGVPIFPMPQALFEKEWNEEILARWASFAAGAARENGAALLAIGGGEPAPGTTPEMLAERLAQAVELLVQRTPVAHIFLEGGGTASAVMRLLGLDRFHTGASPGAGVGSLRPVEQDGPEFLIKPGSYPWPEAVWEKLAARS
jgi:uncharacterized protein YgbK (DUF1537 family)